MTKAELAMIVVRLDPELKAAVEALAQADDRSLNSFIVRALRQLVSDQDKKGKRK